MANSIIYDFDRLAKPGLPHVGLSHFLFGFLCVVKPFPSYRDFLFDLFWHSLPSMSFADLFFMFFRELESFSHIKTVNSPQRYINTAVIETLSEMPH